jgi:Raf kinase inhibitor-like YbhB/YbcL family protein
MDFSPLNLHITGYPNGDRMPTQHATIQGGGKNLSIGLSWTPLPAAQSYAIVFDDKHPVANGWVHWVVVDIPNTVTDIPEGASRSDAMPTGSRELVTSWGQTGYDGPQPPIGSGDHEYVVTLYALDVPTFDAPEPFDRQRLFNALNQHAIAEEQWSGWFERK